MKIEKVNDNQIRCTLTKEDLEEREIKISEIAYGSDKAKSLFRDVMQQANYEYGFEAEDIPLMIEAIPMSTGCIVFIITKVEDPEELDTRFSKFAPSVHEDEEDDDDDIFDSDESSNVLDNPAGKPSDVFDLFKKIASGASAAAKKAKEAAEAGSKMPTPIEKPSNKQLPAIRLFMFESLDAVANASKVLVKYYHGLSTLYKNPSDGTYIMLMTMGRSDQKEFIKVCNLLMEYSTSEKTTPATIAFIEEHYDLLVEDQAIQAMSQI